MLLDINMHGKLRIEACRAIRIAGGSNRSVPHLPGKCLIGAKSDYNSCRETNIILRGWRSIDSIKPRQKIVSLRDAKCKMTVECDVQASSDCHGEAVFTCPNAGRARVQARSSDKKLHERG